VNRGLIFGAGVALAAVAWLAIDGGASGEAQETIDPADYSTSITNPLFPLSSIGPKVFEGEETDPDTDETLVARLESRVLPETTVVAGVTVTVLEEKAYEDGELVELALDYFAQHRDGSVWYFGERVDNYEDGVLRDHAGEWLAGEDGNEPGIIMPAQPAVGQTYQQENAPGVAEDMATVLALDEAVSVPAGDYDGCMRTREFTPLEPGIEEFKWHCPGVGLAREEGDGSVLELVSVGPAPAPQPTATVAATVPAPAPTATRPAGIVAPSTGSGRGSEGASGAWMWLVIGACGAAAIAAGISVRRRTR
jgi:hypothetical protein